MGKFIMKKAGEGFMFNLLANNGQIICTSQTYSSKTACKTGIESVRKNAAVKVEDQTLEKFEPMTNPKYEVYVDKGGQYRFRLKASNGEIVIASQGYSTKASCKNGIESIGKNAPDSAVEDTTVKSEETGTKTVAKPAAKTAKPAAKTATKPAAKKPASKPAAKTAAKKPAAKK